MERCGDTSADPPLARPVATPSCLRSCFPSRPVAPSRESDPSIFSVGIKYSLVSLVRRRWSTLRLSSGCKKFISEFRQSSGVVGDSCLLFVKSALAALWPSPTWDQIGEGHVHLAYLILLRGARQSSTNGLVGCFKRNKTGFRAAFCGRANFLLRGILQLWIFCSHFPAQGRCQMLAGGS